jgi:hypothetical protein
VITRVWRESFGQWWAELWMPRAPGDPPPPFRRLDRADEPTPPPGYRREAIQLRSTRRSAVRAAHRMRARYESGIHPTIDRPEAEQV